MGSPLSFLDMNVEDRKRIFLDILPEEEFIDRRIETSQMIEPESDSEDGEINFVDEYDADGARVMGGAVGQAAMKTMSEFNKTKTYTSGFNTVKQRATDGFIENY